MKYLNQLDHPDIPYPTDAATEGSRFHDLSIKEAGCGLCSLAMMVDRLTTKTISLKRLIALSLKHKANLHPGTDMKILGPVVADLYDLDFSTHQQREKGHAALKERRQRHRQRGRRPGRLYRSIFPRRPLCPAFIRRKGQHLCPGSVFKGGQIRGTGKRGKGAPGRSLCLLLPGADGKGNR